jgi:endonuclease/exonuclease/phosphatase family metal-dependent hydrolase
LIRNVITGTVTYVAMALGAVQLVGFQAEPPVSDLQIRAILGEPRRNERQPPTDGRLKIVSWNIEQGVKYERVRDALRTFDADVYLLQEVDFGVRRSGYKNVARQLADDLEMNWIFGGEFQELGQGRGNRPAITGQAVLSRYAISGAIALPFENQARLRWALDPFQPRRGGRMALRAETAGILVYNAHLESAKNDNFRHKQLDEMLLDYQRSGLADRPVIFAGDFNTEQTPARSPLVLCLTTTGFVDALGIPDAPRRTTLRHANPLDWIFIRNLTSEQGRVVEIREASDHFPLEASVTVQPQAPGTSAGAVPHRK